VAIDRPANPRGQYWRYNFIYATDFQVTMSSLERGVPSSLQKSSRLDEKRNAMHL
jgi:hypothetical protein